jgi:hypothetical protein
VNEEQWPLREVVFVEDVKNVPVGKVCSKELRISYLLPHFGSLKVFMVSV